MARKRYSDEDTGKMSTATIGPATENTTYSGNYSPGAYNSSFTTSYNSNTIDFYKPAANLVYQVYEKLPQGARAGQFHDAYEIYN